MILASAAFCTYVIIQFLVLIYALKFKWKDLHGSNLEQQKVSILIPCRNESKDLPRLLSSLEKLEYPVDQFDIWLADDQSSDDTAEILAKWCEIEENRHFIQIQKEQEGKFHSNGKANALAILCRQAQGELFFFTDADCEVPSTWVAEGVSSFPSEVGMLLGVTQVQSASLFGQMQEVDWWHTLGIVKVMNDLNLGLTGLGNNMIVRQDALQKSGGFESLPDSLTEDLALCRQLLTHGYQVAQHVSPAILAKTKAENGLIDFLKQRKRWLSGVVTLPLIWQVVLSLELSFYPAVFYLLYKMPLLGALLWVVKILIQGVFLKKFAFKAGESPSWFYLLLFDFYQIMSSTISILYYFWPSKTIWKSRKYT